MSSNGWKEVKLGDVIYFNPRESLSKGEVAKKIAMEKLKPYSREIDGFELAEFNGGAKFRKGDTLVARITPCLENGKTAQVTILGDDEIGFGSTEYIVLREKVKETYNNFIYYFSISPKFRDIAIKSMVGTSGRQRVQQDVLENAVFSIPPLVEQKAIAATLSCLDDKIELNNRINMNLEEMAQVIFKSWFIDFEPFQDGEFEDSELGRIPKGWRVGNIYEICDVIYGAAYKSMLFNEAGIGLPLIRIRDLKTFKPQFYTDEKHPKAELIHLGDILVGMDAEFRPCIWKGEDGVLNQRVCKFAPKYEYVNNYFIYSIIKPHMEFIENFKVGTTVSHIGKSDIDKIRIIIPTSDILLDFKNTVDPLFKLILINSAENQTLTNIRDTLLPKLMSGEIRVPKEEVE